MSIDCVQTTARSAWFSGRMWRRAQQCLKCHDNFINFPFFLFGPKSCCLLCDQQPNSIFIFSHVLRVCIFLTLSLLLLQSNDDKEKANSPFESNGIKKDDQGNATNGVAVNGIDDDKGFKWVLPRFFYSSLSLLCSCICIRISFAFSNVFLICICIWKLKCVWNENVYSAFCAGCPMMLKPVANKRFGYWRYCSVERNVAHTQIAHNSVRVVAVSVQDEASEKLILCAYEMHVQRFFLICRPLWGRFDKPRISIWIQTFPHV